MNFKALILILVCSLSLITVKAQNDSIPDNPKKWSLSGYVSEMPSFIMMNPDSNLLWENLLHNRLDFEWNPLKNWKLNIGMRNRLIIGNIVQYNGFAESIDFDKGGANLSWNLIDEKNVLLNTSFDRFFITFEKNKWNVKLGRQRINWGQTLVWNPNDIFNTYSYFDFDYPERSGCDAIRATYYHSETSSSEIAASINAEDDVTAALLHRWNYWNTDFQVIGGMLNSSNALLGGAWTSDFKGLNFRGEFTYFRPFKNFSDTSGTIAISIGTDYMFSNSLMLQAEVLYNNVNNIFKQFGVLGIYAEPLSAKYLSVCDWTLFAQASYPITPRFTANLSGMYFVDIQSFYLGANATFSLNNDLDFSAILQYFAGDNNQIHTQTTMAFLRLKYSF